MDDNALYTVRILDGDIYDEDLEYASCISLGDVSVDEIRTIMNIFVPRGFSVIVRNKKSIID